MVEHIPTTSLRACKGIIYLFSFSLFLCNHLLDITHVHTIVKVHTILIIDIHFFSQTFTLHLLLYPFVFFFLIHGFLTHGKTLSSLHGATECFTFIVNGVPTLHIS